MRRIFRGANIWLSVSHGDDEVIVAGRIIPVSEVIMARGLTAKSCKSLSVTLLFSTDGTELG